MTTLTSSAATARRLPWIAAALATLACAPALAGPLGTGGGTFSIVAQAQLSQLAHDSETDSFSSASDTFASLPSVGIRKSTFNADVQAGASPFQASSYVVKANHGVNVSTTRASFDGSALLVEASPALAALIPAGQTFLDVLVHYQLTVGPGGAGGYTITPTIPGVSRQSTAQISASVWADSLLGHSLANGRFDAVNGSTFHSFSATGIFAGLEEGSLIDLAAAGGTVDVALAARVSPDVPDGGVIGLGASVGFLTALASGSGAFVNAAVDVKLASISVTLVDGRPLGDLGVHTTLLPSAVPEPASAALLLGGMAVLIRASRWRLRTGTRTT